MTTRKEQEMTNNFFKDFTKSITDNLPEGLRQLHEEIDTKIKEGVEHAFSSFRGVKADDFEVYRNQLLQAEARLEALEKKVAELESQLQTTQKV